MHSTAVSALKRAILLLGDQHRNVKPDQAGDGLPQFLIRPTIMTSWTRIALTLWFLLAFKSVQSQSNITCLPGFSWMGEFVALGRA